MSRWACHACILHYRLVVHALRSWDSGSSALPHVRGDYGQWNLQRCVGEQRFPSIVLYTEKESFIRDNTINWLNNSIQAEETPHTTVEQGRQRRWSVSGWGGIVRNFSKATTDFLTLHRTSSRDSGAVTATNAGGYDTTRRTSTCFT